MPRCPGCNTECNGGKGLSLHLRLTQNLACNAILTAAENHVGSIPRKFAVPEEPTQEQPQDYGLPQGQTVFGGDFFGEDYTAGDFPADSDDERDDSDEESETDLVEEDREAASRADLESGYEAPRMPIADEDDPMTTPSRHPPPTPDARKIAEDRFHHKPIVEKFPGGRAGRPIPLTQAPTQNSEQRYGSALDDSPTNNPYAPFKSKLDWEVARWAKLRGSGSTAFTDLLHIEGVRESLGLSYGTSTQLNTIIDDKLPGRPKFPRSEVIVNGEVFHLYSRDIMECRHYIDKDKTIRMYHNMHTGKWWWSTQEEVEKEHPGATIIPIIISSDKTQLTVFGNKTAYPVYMTIGNIPKKSAVNPLVGPTITFCDHFDTSMIDNLSQDLQKFATIVTLVLILLAVIGVRLLKTPRRPWKSR
ncbi:hypothetical protein B0H14DRAFT_3518585 [Mycena olivaceomarginata]|nr:hypothetical protein B0H14DRAFT_3518585 [Mycena olivaceomarginata]